MIHFNPGLLSIPDFFKTNLQISLLLLFIAFTVGFISSTAIHKFSNPRKGEDLLKKQIFNDHIYPIWIYSTETLKILAANKAFCKKFNYKEKEIKNMSILNLRPVSQQFKVKSFMRDVKEFKMPFANSGIWLYRKKNGDNFRMQVSTLFSGLNGTRAVIGVDMDEVVNLKEQLKQVAWMQSHVVRKPLANMMSLVDLMNEPLVTDTEKKQYVKLLKQCCDELDGKIKEIVRSTETDKQELSLPASKHFITDTWKLSVKYLQGLAIFN